MTEKQKNIRNRLLVFSLGIPTVLAILILLPHFNHLATTLTVMLVSAIASWELDPLFPSNTEQKNSYRPLAPLFGLFFPALCYLELQEIIPAESTIAIGMLLIAIIIGAQAFRRRPETFANIQNLVPAKVFLLLYPGAFMAYIVRTGFLENAPVLLTVFVTAVFLNDSAAYAGGMLFGRRNGNVLPISPNKSIAGFCSGYFGSILVTVIAANTMPNVFPGPISKAVLFGFIIGTASIIGDLGESALKRSATIKDSGSIIPGRGGLLDSIDSIAFAAPFFYYSYHLLFLSGV